MKCVSMMVELECEGAGWGDVILERGQVDASYLIDHH